ncbi:MAG: FAD binding domain-containing protein [Spirochaetaceae bacterium]|jgi:CO/xanthine dehydrogenase FAD-binding subunit|nr:FAD binding domain-containing protein [Spirochaetaceae bacterium]
MAVLHNQVLRPGSFSELFPVWNRYPDAVLFAGGTALIRSQGRELPKLPDNILSLERIDELHRITRTERYLEIGAAVKLSDIIALGKIVPDAFSGALRGIASPSVRNLATIGGNLCVCGDATAPMAALDARYELRSAGGIRWISANRFSSLPMNLKAQELLSRIRIPLEQWTYTIYRKFHSPPENDGGVLLILVQNQKDILAKIQIVFAGQTLYRDKNSETFLEGKALPLDRKDAFHYRDLWKTYLEGLGQPGPLLRSKIINGIEAAILGLSD